MTHPVMHHLMMVSVPMVPVVMMFGRGESRPHNRSNQRQAKG